MSAARAGPFAPAPSPRASRVAPRRRRRLGARRGRPPPRARSGTRRDDVIRDGDDAADEEENARRGPRGLDPPDATRGVGPRASSFASSWDAREARSSRSRPADDSAADYLSTLGARSGNVSTEVGARKGVVDDVFAGTANASFNLGADADIADGTLRYLGDRVAVRTLATAVDGAFVPPRFLDRVALHVAKNHVADDRESSARLGAVPLILAIWGEKGAGKSYTLELCLRLLGCAPVVMSAGELEDELAGEPGRLVRRRYRDASRLAKREGRLAALVINDLDAGAGAFRHTQRTVNTQTLVGTLMNLCDHPNRTNASALFGDEDDGTGGADAAAQTEPDLDEASRRGGSRTNSYANSYAATERLRRVPVIVTANDLGTLYAPLLRDGRMDKFLWAPTTREKAAAVRATMADAGVSDADAVKLVEAFPEQPMDFFGALHARTVDDAVRDWIAANGGAGPELGEALLGGFDRRRSSARTPLERPTLTLDRLVALGEALVREQEHVNTHKLAEEYMRGVREVPGAREAAEKAALAAAEAATRRARERRVAEANTRASRSDAAVDAAERARRAMARASATEPRRRVELVSPADRASAANERARRETAAEVAAAAGGSGGWGGGGGGGGWTILDGGATAEKSVTEKEEWDAFDDMDWG